MKKRTECSSCLTSRTVPSLKVHLTMSVSGLALLTTSLFSSLLQKEENSCSLMRCQTALKGASMTADSLTEVDVGMRVLDMIADVCVCVYGITKSCREVERWEKRMCVCVYMRCGTPFFFSQCNYLGRPTEERITEVVKWGRWLFARDASVAS